MSVPAVAAMSVPVGVTPSSGTSGVLDPPAAGSTTAAPVSAGGAAASVVSASAGGADPVSVGVSAGAAPAPVSHGILTP